MLLNNIQDVHCFLEAIPQFKNEGKQAADFSLERFEQFCSALGNPQDDFPAIHIAGSNGKGSTCHILGSVFHAAGYNAGVYTSPHILSYSERFTINGRQIGDEELVQFMGEHQSLMQRFQLTYFEVSTAIAFWWFARQKVDVAIIETGLGGRLDATNIITPLVSAITSVSMDHTDILGDTISAIAKEKAGIIKKNVPVVTGNVLGEAAKIIRKVAREKESSYYPVEPLNPQWDDGQYTIQAQDRLLRFESPLQTPVQAFNIAVSWQVTQILKPKFSISENKFRRGVEKVRALYPNRGRFEKMHSKYEWYFDGGHNLEAVRAMKQMVETIQPIEETILVLSLMKDKINEKLMIEFSEFKKIVYHTLPLGRAATVDDVQKWLPHAKPFPAEQDVSKTLVKEFSSELVIFAGSFYFYAAVRDWLLSMENR